MPRKKATSAKKLTRPAAAGARASGNKKTAASTRLRSRAKTAKTASTAAPRKRTKSSSGKPQLVHSASRQESW